MPEKHLFEYAVIRVVPRVEREEFLNVGVIIFAKSLKFLQMKYEVNRQKLLHFSDLLDIPEIEEYLKAYEQISIGSSESGPIGKLDQPSRFRWLTATRSTIVQSSRVHSGFCAEPEKALQDLFSKFVL
jgi:Protein of unknown function (DUF3037)